MARDVEFDLNANDKSGPAFDGVAKNSEKTQEKIRRDSEKTSENASSGWVKAFVKAGPKVVGAVGEAAATAAKSAGPILGGAAIAAAPLIAGTLSAAIIGGAGIGGVIGGVALVKDDPRVAAAGADLGKNLMSDLKDFAKPFVDPVLSAIDTIEDRFGKVEGNLQSIFAGSAKFVEPLTAGATDFATGVIRGVDALVSRGGPVIDAIGDMASELGDDTENFLTDIAGGADGAAASVRQLTDLLGGTITVVGGLITGINTVNGALESVGLSPGILQLIGKYADAGDEAGTFTRHVQGSTDAVDGQGQAALTTAAELADYKQQLRGATDANLDLYGSTTAAAEAIAIANTAIRENGEGLQLSTERGRENRETLANLAESLNANYDAYVQVNGAGAGANEVLRQNREAFIRAGTAASGSAAKARQLADDLLGIPEKRTPKVELLDNATGKINNVINRLAAVKSKTVTLNIAVRQSGDASALRKQSLPSGLSAASYFAQTTGEGTYRTGGPTPVNVSSSVQVALDGKPFRDYTATAIKAEGARAAWRQKVGTRHGVDHRV